MTKNDSATNDHDPVPLHETDTALKENDGDSTDSKLTGNEKGTDEPKYKENVVSESQNNEGDEAGGQDEPLEDGKNTHIEPADGARAVKESAEKEKVLESDSVGGIEKKSDNTEKCEIGVESDKATENEINNDGKIDDAKETVIKESAKNEEITDDAKDQDTSDAVNDEEMADAVKDQEVADKDEEMTDEVEGADGDGDEKMSEEEKDNETADEVKDGDMADNVKDETKKGKRGKGQHAKKKGTVKEKDEKDKSEEEEGEGRKRKRGEGKRKPKEPDTPAPRITDRPVRERKSVERLVASVEKQRTKGFVIGKGQGTVLKDIPVVFDKLSRKKNVETVKALHLILYGRRAKIAQCKSNLLQFSGFVWHENEEKQRSKIKDKLDKLNKDKLNDFCDVLDVSVSKAAKKDDIITRLLDFMAAPHAASEAGLGDKEQSNSSRKRKRNSDAGGSNKSEEKPGSSSSKKTMKSVKPSKAKSSSDDESDEDQENEVDENGTASAEDEPPNKSESDKEADDSEGDENDDSESSEPPKKSSSKAKSSAKEKGKKSITPKRETSTPQKTSSKKASTKKVKVETSNEKNSKPTPKMKGDEEGSPKKPKRTTKSTPKEKSGTKGGRATNKSKKDDAKPSVEELRQAICDILKEVDFNTATFTDILKKLASHFKVDLMPRKTEIKGIIQDELTKLAEADTEEESEGEKDMTEAASNKDENSD